MFSSRFPPHDLAPGRRSPARPRPRPTGAGVRRRARRRPRRAGRRRGFGAGPRGGCADTPGADRSHPLQPGRAPLAGDGCRLVPHRFARRRLERLASCAARGRGRSGSGQRRESRPARLEDREPVLDRPCDADPVPDPGRVARLRAFFLWSAPRAIPRRSSPGRSGPAADPDAEAVGRRRVDRARIALLLVAACVLRRPPHRGHEADSPSQSAAVVRGVLSTTCARTAGTTSATTSSSTASARSSRAAAGGITRNVIGAHAQGFNTGSVGVAILGTYTSASITPAARDALTNLLAWRLDLAHVDPVSRLVRASGGNDKYPAGTPVTLAAVSGHRDTGNTSCPGTALYAALGSLAGDVLARGGPKIVDPRVQGSLGGSDPLHRAPHGGAPVDGDRPERRRHAGRLGRRHGHEGGLDLGRDDGSRRPLHVLDRRGAGRAARAGTGRTARCRSSSPAFRSRPAWSRRTATGWETRPRSA